jgi:hypothetical protein
MSERRRLMDRVATVTGLFCVLVTFLLLSLGVRVVRADDREGTLMSVDPALEAKLEAPAPAAVPKGAVDLERPGVPAAEIEPGVIVLNTRGFNYGAPAREIDPAAIGHEKAPTQASP